MAEETKYVDRNPIPQDFDLIVECCRVIGARTGFFETISLVLKKLSETHLVVQFFQRARWKGAQ